MVGRSGRSTDSYAHTETATTESAIGTRRPGSVGGGSAAGGYSCCAGDPVGESLDAPLQTSLHCSKLPRAVWPCVARGVRLSPLVSLACGQVVHRYQGECTQADDESGLINGEVRAVIWRGLGQVLVAGNDAKVEKFARDFI